MKKTLDLSDVPGFRTGAAACGLKRKRRGKDPLDIGLLWCPEGAAWAATLTRNRVAAAPVRLCAKRLRGAPRVRAVVVNAGNANACTGARGARDAERMASLAARALGCAPSEVLVASTGVIGRPLPMDRVALGVEAAARSARARGRGALHKAILTTDLAIKRASAFARVGGRRVSVAGCAKGSGMIAPNMATMLGFLATDADISSGALRAIFKGAAVRTFNRVTVDGDTSTNDSAFILASGAAGNRRVTRAGSRDAIALGRAIEEVSGELARAIARDGEGATKLVEVRVKRARSEADAERAARTVAESPLVKTALFGCDPNWGRVLAAAGRSGAALVEGKTRVSFNGVTVFRGRPLAPDAKKLARAFRAREVTVEVDLGLGKSEAAVWTCDLSYDYIKINAEYHT